MFWTNIARFLQYFRNLSNSFINIFAILQGFNEIFSKYSFNITMLCGKCWDLHANVNYKKPKKIERTWLAAVNVDCKKKVIEYWSSSIYCMLCERHTLYVYFWFFLRFCIIDEAAWESMFDIRKTQSDKLVETIIVEALSELTGENAPLPHGHSIQGMLGNSWCSSPHATEDLTTLIHHLSMVSAFALSMRYADRRDCWRGWV